jgi:hypothetical protein
MPDYSNGKIYTIRCRTDDTKIYVGSTIQPLAVRFGGHKRDSKRDKSMNIKLYIEVNDNWDDWYIELYELFPCNCKEELCKREGEIIRRIGNLNSKIAGRNKKEYRIEKADKIKEQKKEYQLENVENKKEYDKQYRIENQDKIKENKKEYYIENADKIKEYMKEYYIENADKIKEINKQYRIDNADKIKARNKQYYLKKKEEKEKLKSIGRNEVPRQI